MIVDKAIDCIHRLDRQIEVAIADAVKSSRGRLQHVVFNAIAKESVAKVPAARLFLLERVQEICRRRERLFRVLDGIRQSIAIRGPAAPGSGGSGSGAGGSSSSNFSLDWLSGMPDGAGVGGARRRSSSKTLSLAAIHREVTQALSDADELCTMELAISRGGTAGDDIERIELFEPLIDSVTSHFNGQSQGGEEAESRAAGHRDDPPASSSSDSGSTSSDNDEETDGKTHRRDARRGGAHSSSGYGGAANHLGPLQRLTEEEYLVSVAFPLLPLGSLGEDVQSWASAAAGGSIKEAPGDDEGTGGPSHAKDPSARLAAEEAVVTASPRLLSVMTHIAERLAIRQALVDLRAEPRIAAPRRQGTRGGVNPTTATTNTHNPPSSQQPQPVFPLRLACASESLAYCVLQLYASAVTAEVQRSGLEATMNALVRLCKDKECRGVRSATVANEEDDDDVAAKEPNSDVLPPLPLSVRRYIAKYALPRGSELSKQSPSARNLVRTFVYDSLR